MRGQVRIHQDKIVARKRRELLHKSLVVLTILCVLVSGLSLLSHLDNLKISNIEVSGIGVLPYDTATATALEKISGNYLGIFSKSNSFLYPEDDIAAALTALPPVKKADVKRASLTSLSIEITERKKEFIWCVGETSVDCFMLDYDGFAFARAETISDIDFIYRGDLSPEPLGTYVRPVDEFRSIRFFLEELEGLSVSPREVAISPTHIMTVYLGRGGKIIVDVKDDLSVILGNIAAVINDKAVAPSLPQFLDRLDYIKLDSGNKVVYRMR